MADGIIADIGGTNARFALLDGGDMRDETVLKCADFTDLSEAVKAYIAGAGLKKVPRHASFAVAGPLRNGQVEMVNGAWPYIPVEAVKETLGFEYFAVMNDFKAVALSVPHLQAQEIRKVSESGNAVPMAPIGVIGPGTGLGVASLAWDGKKYVAIPGEGGHVTMAAKTQREFDIFRFLVDEKYSHVSAERVCSGKGLINLYNAIRTIDGRFDMPDLEPAEISARGTAGTCDICAECMRLMMSFLGRVAGNLALTIGAHGGVYIAGGIAPKLGNYLDNSHFREEFEAKGRLKDYMADIPTFVILNELCALTGLRADLMAA